MSLLGFVRPSPNPSGGGGNRTIDLGNGSEVFYVPRFLSPDRSWEWFHYLDKEIPWTRPLIHVFGRSCVQPRDVCYVASKGLSDLQYSGYQPHAYSWDDYPVLKDILEAVHEALPGSKFNSLLLNRYKTGSDYVSWHSDDEKLYGPAPEIASVSFGCEREFLLKKKPTKKSVWISSKNARCCTFRTTTGKQETQEQSHRAACFCSKTRFNVGNEGIHTEGLATLCAEAFKGELC
ncbi:DNA oxidative demethylase ALKBH2 isoform X1 [Dioscorea cayenensis subsp. rotundata]|uniref:DNA oxidative demethylase ALKBH2 isoform X1 n=1 Tax=Dioscorea cayennensis subsp. rotundata TaxID=55577 RepID=A0AB40BAA8_DIOCR|nr:DNA oxidative demethylase ALKBH2 isoform X1 [Dioscorea cayenensis subsp. rotundata]